MKKIGEFLAPYDVSPTLLTTIANALKDVDEPCTKIQNNPYILTNIKGIGFKTADELALKMGVAKEDEHRIEAAINYTLLNFCESEGNSCINKVKLYVELDLLLGFERGDRLYEAALMELVASGEVIEFKGGRISPRRLYEAERFLFEEFQRRSKAKDAVIVEDLESFLADDELRLGEEQKRAVELINSGVKLLFLVGYAGTGKSTTSRTILNLLATKHAKESIMTCALSGIASQRIAETTGFESATIQSLLVKHEVSETFPYEVLLIDEASMINSNLFAQVIKKVKKDAVIIIVGDDAQLPPIGAGNVLSDMLELGFAPIVKLTKIYRQSKEQAIAIIANEIRKGVVPEYFKNYKDFFFHDKSIQNYYALKNTLSQSKLHEVREQNHQAIIATILELVMQHLAHARELLNAKKIGEYLRYFQIITPMKGSTLGVENLNAILQNYFNPNPKRCLKYGKKELRLMDKVVHTKNENMSAWSASEFKEGDESSKRRVFNGMSGLLFRMDEEEELLYVYYPNEDMVVEYSYDEAKEYLMLSYALTIHKVQGMEYEVVVIPMTLSHFIMLNTKLIYTAITRAKKQCHVVGERAAFEAGCRRLESTKRDTVLLELGKKVF